MSELHYFVDLNELNDDDDDDTHSASTWMTNRSTVTEIILTHKETNRSRRLPPTA